MNTCTQQPKITCSVSCIAKLDAWIAVTKNATSSLVLMSLISMLGLGNAHADIQLNQASPDFALKSKEHGNLRASEQQGNVVMINFWASWCGPCREELPKMEELYQDYQDLGFEILAVNVDDEESKADVLLDDIKVSFPVLYDTLGEVSQMYDVNAMPTTVMLDRNGKIRVIHPGYRAGDEKKYEKAIKMLIREQ